MSIIKLIKKLFMAKLQYKPFPKDDQAEALEFIKAYKKQNPAKYEMKKEALFKMAGISLETEVEEPKDASDVELEEVAKKVTKKNAK